MVSLLTTFNKNSEKKFSPWKEVVSEIDNHKEAVIQSMDDTRGAGWISTLNILAEMVTRGDVQPREMLLMATMMPGVPAS